MDSKDQIKEAFARAKQDIDSLKNQFNSILQDIQDIKRTLSSNPTDNQTANRLNSTVKEEIPSDEEYIPSLPTHELAYKALKPHIYHISTGNRGVPTDKPTNSQTNQHSSISSGNKQIDQIENVSKLLESLDTIKKELRYKFKHLTKQEMIVFSTLYQLEEEQFVVDYALISKKLALSESSIRDYIQRIISKGIPIQKTKENNKKILLSLPKDFKQLASLQTILQLREL